MKVTVSNFYQQSSTKKRNWVNERLNKSCKKEKKVVKKWKKFFFLPKLAFNSICATKMMKNEN